MALAWWLALFFPLCWGTISWIFKRLPIWSETYRQERLAIDNRVLEDLHGDTFALVVYLAQKAAGVVLEIAYAATIAALLANRSAVPLRWTIFSAGLALASGVFGIAWRVRTVMKKLADYDNTMKALKAQQKLRP